MHRLIRLAAGVLASAMVFSVRAGESLPRSAPEGQGVSSVALLDLVETLDDRFEGMHSVMIVRHGRVIAEGWWAPYDAEHNHVLFSLSKSFTSSAVGFAVAEGKVSVDDLVVELFPEDVPSDASANLKAMRVRDLLTMTTGHQDEPSTAADTVSARSFLAQPVPHLPGTHFKYNTAATFMQSAIVQKVTGQTVLEYLRPRLFEPLGIENPVWDTNFQGICLGGYGLRVRTEDIAKFGQMYLQKGAWKGQQLLPREWVDVATSRQVSNGSNPRSDWNQGYGFQFWRCRHNAYRGDGAFGQYCVVMPDQDVVVAITSGVRDMQAVLNVIWDRLLPACEAKELPANEAALKRLRDGMARLEVPLVEGAATSAMASRVLNHRYVFPANDRKMESAALHSTSDGKGLSLEMARDGTTMRFDADFRRWKKQRAAFPGGRLAQYADEPVAGTFAWEAEDTAVIKVCAYETPFHMTFRLKFTDDSVTFDVESNVSFGPTKQPSLVGKRDR